MNKLIAAVIAIFAITTNTVAKDENQDTFRPFQFDWTEVAPDIWTAVRPDPHRHPVLGTSTVVVGKTGVVVFDGGGLPDQADQVIAKIKSLTDAPVTHVIISHWHGDHNFGVYRFAETWPNVELVTHDFTNRAFNSQKIRYIDSYPKYLESTVAGIQKYLDEVDAGNQPALHADDRYEYERIVRYKDEIAPQYALARVPKPTKVIDGDLTLDLDGRKIEILHLGHANTEGDLVMWLPGAKIVATGDMVVHPSPYAFNMPPRAYAATLKSLNTLGYKTLVPGHGDIQRNSDYVDLLISVSEELADKRDALVEEGVSPEDMAARLDQSHHEEAFVGKVNGYHGFFDGYFAKPFIAAAIKELGDGPMVELLPVEEK